MKVYNKNWLTTKKLLILIWNVYEYKTIIHVENHTNLYILYAPYGRILQPPPLPPKNI